MRELNRREFLNLSAALGSGLIIGMNSSVLAQQIPIDSKSDPARFSPFLKISEDGYVIIYVPVPEIGQGVRTALSMILADELDADWQQVRVEQAVAGAEYGNMSAAGSQSISQYYEPLRRAGATARKMLKTVAAERWSVSVNSVQTKNGVVMNEAGGEELSYYDLAQAAASLPIPEEIQLKEQKDMQLIGRSAKGVDAKDIVTGKAMFGSDVIMDNMKYVAIERCPVRGGSLKSFDASEALASEGVLDVIEIEPLAPIGYAEVKPGVAVIALDSAAALRGKRLLKVEWDTGDVRLDSSASLKEQFDPHKGKPWEFEMRRSDDFDSVIAGDDQVLDFDYEIPFWAHFCMEPMNFTASVGADAAVLKGSSQRPRLIQSLVAHVFDLPPDKVKVESTLAGGGFGRRLAVDYALEAAIVSKKISAPAKVIWTREDDVLHDYFRSISFHTLRVGIKDGMINSWYHHLMTKPIADGPRYEVTGAADLPFAIPNIAIGYSPIESPVQIGSWRSVAHSYNAFVVNNTITETAVTSGKDPLETYLELIGGRKNTTISLPLSGSRGEVYCDLQRLKKVLLKAAKLSNWAKETPGIAKGIACTFYKTSYAAHVAEMSEKDGKIRLEKITAVLDCGRVINPDDVKAQMEGSISDAISVTLKSGISIQDGKPLETNFDTHQVTRITDMPDLELYVMESDDMPGGAGEPPFPSVAPAIANAYFRLTGNSVRKLPITI